MLAAIARDVVDTTSFAVDTVASSLRTFVAACTGVRLDDPTARIATSATSAALIATLIACAMHLDDPWWATISGYMATQRSGPASVQRAFLRITGTIAGAAVGVVTVAWAAYDIPGCCLLIFAACTISSIGNNVSQYAYSWLLAGITCVLVTLTSLGNPSLAPQVAIIRALEIIIGSIVAAVVSIVLNPAPSVPPVEPAGWSGLFGSKIYIITHSMR
ncbi:MAG: FUSC family protein [Rhodopila sp.]